ncbi:hypothetical protein [Streptomyces sp. NPDC091217]|uniref:hypothetical protein n=1 Tax=Streptomyces sp. NPDC091217 TaxID=3365975 RepID=UPI00382AF761
MTRTHHPLSGPESSVLLDPPRPVPGWAQRLPHWPYLQNVDAALAGRGLAPGIVRAYYTGAGPGGRMRLTLTWDASRVVGPAGIRFHWDDERGWAYAHCPTNPRIPARIRPILPLGRVFADPEDVAGTAEAIVRAGRMPGGEFGAEWDRTAEIRAAITSF